MAFGFPSRVFCDDAYSWYEFAIDDWLLVTIAMIENTIAIKMEFTNPAIPYLEVPPPVASHIHP